VSVFIIFIDIDMMWARSCSLWHGIGSSFRSLPLPGAGSGNGLRRRIRRKSLSAEEQGRFLSSMTVFDRKVKREQRGRAAFLDAGGKYEYLRKHVGEVLVDRIEDIKRDFPLALDVGCHTGQLYELICREQGLGGEGGIGGVKRLVQCDISHRALQRAQQRQASLEAECSSRVETHFVQADEEFLPFPAETFDLVLSNLSLHWVNDLPSAMTQIRNVLKVRHSLFLLHADSFLLIYTDLLSRMVCLSEACWGAPL
jgi:SAM-dependent methyltransferase